MSGRFNRNDDNQLIPVAIAAVFTVAGLASAAYLYTSSSRALQSSSLSQKNQQNKDNKVTSAAKNEVDDTSAPTTTTTTNAAAPANDASKDKQQQQQSTNKSSTSSNVKSNSLEIPQAKGAEATNFFKNGDYSKAIELYTEALEATPEEYKTERAVLLNNRAAAYDKVGNKDESIKDCTSVLDIDPLHQKALQRRIRMCSFVALTATEEELQTQKVKAYSSTALGDLALFCALEIMQEREVPANIGEQMEKIMKSVGKTEAKEILQKRKKEITNKDPHQLFPRTTFITTYFYSFSSDATKLRSPPAASQLALINTSIEDLDNEDVVDEEDTAADPETARRKKKLSLLYDLSRVHLFRKEYEDCFKILREIAPQAEDESNKLNKELKANIFIDYGTFLHLMGNLAEAKVALEKAIAFNPESLNAYIKLAGVSVEMQQMDKCQAYFTSAEVVVQRIRQDQELFQKRKNDVADYHFHHGFLHMLGQKLSDAELEMREAIKISPNFAAAHMQLGVVLFRQGKAEDALASLENACLQSPELPDVHNYYGEVLLSLERYEEAENQFMQAYNADFSHPTSYINRALSRIQHVNNIITQSGGNGLSESDISHAEAIRAEAFKLFDKAIEVDPTCETVYVHMANDFFQRGELPKAIELFQKAIDLSKTSNDLEEYCAMRASCQAQMDAAAVLTKIKARFQQGSQ